jgi:hypothetical protein
VNEAQKDRNFHKVTLAKNNVFAIALEERAIRMDNRSVNITQELTIAHGDEPASVAPQ